MQTSKLQQPALKVVLCLHDPNSTYWAYTAAAIQSLCIHSSRALSIQLLIDDSVAQTTVDALTQRACNLGHDLTATRVDLPEGVSAKAMGKFSPAAMFRLYAPTLFKQDEVLLYVDSDVVFNGLDVQDLMDAVPSDAVIAGVHDPFMQLFAAKELALVGLDGARYINSGVLVLRPKQISEDLIGGFVAFSASFQQVLHLDQNYINHAFAGRIAFLDDRFNFQVNLGNRQMFHPLSFYDNKLLHFTGRIKPLDGALCPAWLPFWRYSGSDTPAAKQFDNKPLKYLVPLKGRPHVGKLLDGGEHS